MAGTENPVCRFSEFFRSVASVPSGSEANSAPERSLVIDWQQLAEFDANLAHRLRDHPDATMGYACEALMTMAESRLSPSRLQQLRIRNLDVDTPVERLETVDLGQLVSVSGLVVATTDVRPRLTVIAVECQQCGTITKGRSLALTTPDIASCRSCGREEYVPITTESDFVDSQHARLRVSDSATETESETIHIRLDATLQPVTPGAAMTVTGVVRPCRRTELNRQATIQTRFIDSVGNSSRNKAPEPSPLPAGWTLSDLAAQSTYLTNITEAVASSVPGFRRAKLALALQYVTPTPLGSTTAGTGPHLLLLAPDTGQWRRLLEGYSLLPKRVRRVLPGRHKTVSFCMI
jgi:replicative DNA helicase Mcm